MPDELGRLSNSILGTLNNVVGFFGAVIGLLGVVLTFGLWRYKTRPAIKVQVTNNANKIYLDIRNPKDATVQIRNIKLVKKTLFLSNPKQGSHAFNYLVESKPSGIYSSQHDDVDITIEPHGKVETLEIDYLNIASLYHFFLPYEYESTEQVRVLSKKTKMITCHIAIFLKSGSINYIALPESFYFYYRYREGIKMDRDLAIISGKTDVSRHFSSKESESLHKEYCLNLYQIVRRNYHLLWR